MRIVFLNVTGSLGGAERVLLTLLRELRRLRPTWKLTVIAGGSGPLIPALEELGCTAMVLPFNRELAELGDWGNSGKLALFGDLLRVVPSVIRYRKALREKLRILAPAIIQTNGFKMHALGALARVPGAVLFWHVHDFVSNRTVMRTLLHWLSLRPARVIAISSAVAADLERVLRKPAVLHTIWNSVAIPEQPATASPSSAEIRVGLAGTFARWKGHKVFLRALSLLQGDIPWRGFLIGGEVYGRAASQWTQAELEHYAAELGIGPRIEFTGFLIDPEAMVQSLDIAVHAAEEPEPFGLVIAEAMALGRAVVSTSQQIVTDGVDGLVCKRGDASGLASAIERLARDPALRASLGRAAYITASRRFKAERMAREFIALYEGAHP